jgi:hypothetical protein
VATPGASVKPLLEIESIRDQISFTAIGARPYLFSLEACPAKPKLLIDSKIDFGAILLPTLDSSKALPAKNSDRTFTKYIKIENVGPVAANINVDFDMELPLKISPANFTLPARASSDINSASHPIQTLKVEFQPISAGIFSGKIYLNACQTSNKNEDRGYKNPKREEEVSAAVSRDLAPLDFIIVNAQALDRQIYLYQQDGSSEINDCNIDFGALYQGEIANYTAKVVNNGPAAVRWV